MDLGNPVRPSDGGDGLDDIVCGECNDGNDGLYDMDGDEESGQIKPKLLSAPSAPSRQERMEHNIAHIPFRAWCKSCVGGKCKSDKHTTSENRSEDTIPVVGVDYAFLDKTTESGKLREEMTTLVIKDRMSGCIFGVPVPRKGMDPH